MLSVLSTRNATSTWDEKERTGGLAALGKYMDCGDSVPLCGTLTLEQSRFEKLRRRAAAVRLPYATTCATGHE